MDRLIKQTLKLSTVISQNLTVTFTFYKYIIIAYFAPKQAYNLVPRTINSILSKRG